MVPVPSVSIMPERDLGKAPALECLHLGIDFGGLKAVDDFNITVGRTEICGLIGPNGAGKTTVFNLLTKVYAPTRGTIMVDGHDTAGLDPARVNRLGVARTFQNIRLFNTLTVEENVIAIMLIEHDMNLAMNICEGICVLNFGKIIAKGTPEEIQTNDAVIEAYLGKQKGGEA